jgi:hypothetical protein
VNFLSNFVHTFFNSNFFSGAKQHCGTTHAFCLTKLPETNHSVQRTFKYSSTTFLAHQITNFSSTRRIFKCSFTFDGIDFMYWQSHDFAKVRGLILCSGNAIISLNRILLLKFSSPWCSTDSQILQLFKKV